MGIANKTNVTLRSDKASPLTREEMDGNFSELEHVIDDSVTNEQGLGAIDSRLTDRENELDDAQFGLDRRVIYVDTIADLQALDTSALVDGQAASVYGSEFKYVSGAWNPVGCIDIRAYGAKGDGVTDDTAAIQQCVDECSHVAISDGTYLIDGNDPDGVFGRKGVEVPSNTVIDFYNAEIRVKPSDQDGYNALLFNGVSNVVVNDAVLTGDRYDHIGATGEFGMGMEFFNSENITINRATIKDFWGDGIYIGEMSEGGYSRNLTFNRVICDNNRRQGLSVISVDGLYCYDCEFNNTNGTAPEAGVDFEPNYPFNKLENIRFKNVKTSNNNANGIVFWLPNVDVDGYHIDIEIDGHYAEGNTYGVYFGAAFSNAGTGQIRIKNATSKNAKHGGFSIRNWHRDAPRVIFENLTAINPVTDSSAASGSSNNAFNAFIATGYPFTGIMGGFELHGLEVVDDDSATSYRQGALYVQTDGVENVTLSGIKQVSSGQNSTLGAGWRFTTFKDCKLLNSELLEPIEAAGTYTSESPLVLRDYFYIVQDVGTTLTLPDISGYSPYSFRVSYQGSISYLGVKPPTGGSLYLGSESCPDGVTLPVANRVPGVYLTFNMIGGRWVVTNGSDLLEKIIP